MPNARKPIGSRPSVGNRAKFQVSYDGPALENGLMDVRELSSSLLAIGNLVEAANRRLNGEDARIAVQVRAGFERGSFTVDLVTVQTIVDQVKAIVLGEDVKAARTLIEIIFGGSGLLVLIRWLRGKKPDKVTATKEGSVSVTVNNNTTEVNGDVILLYNDPVVRSQASAAVRPLSREGIESVSIKTPKASKTTIAKEELPYFAEPVAELQGQDSLATEGEYERTLALIKPSFRDDLVWTLTDGTHEISAYMKDEVFLDRVHRRQITFGDGDLLRVRLQWRQTTGPSGLRMHYAILEVLEFIPNPPQKRLPMG